MTKKTHQQWYPWLLLTFCLAILFYHWRGFLSGDTILVHDNLQWYYPGFSFVVDSFRQGSFPLWNGFTHGGEPFYPILPQLRLLDPFTLVFIWFTKNVTKNTVLIFNWHFIIQILLMQWGAYLVLRPFCAHTATRLSLIPILTLSSFVVTPIRQTGFIHQYLWVPFIVYFLLQIVYYKKSSWFHWLCLSGLVGLAWQSYWYTGVLSVILFFGLGLILFKRELLTSLFKDSSTYPKMGVATLIIILMMAPNVVLLSGRDAFEFPVRARGEQYAKFLRGEREARGGAVTYEVPPKEKLEADSGLSLPYSAIKFSGSFSERMDYVQTLFLANANMGVDVGGYWGKISEAFIYFGIIPWIFILFGIFCGNHSLKKVVGFTLGCLVLLSLGPVGGIYPILYHVLLPFRFLRNTHGLVLIIMLFFMFFFVLGMDLLIRKWEQAQGSLLPLWGKSRVLPVLICSVLVPVCVLVPYLMEQKSLYASLGILAFVAGVWVFRFWLRSWEIALAVFLGQILVPVTVLQWSHGHLTYFLLVLLLNIAICWMSLPLITQAYEWPRKGLTTLAFALLLCLDLTLLLHKSNALFRWPSKFTKTLATRYEPTAQPLRQPKQLIGTLRPDGGSIRKQRYLSILERTPYVYSPLHWIGQVFWQKYSIPQVRSMRRVNSLLLLKPYYELAHSDVSDDVLMKVFGVGEPPIQFKKVGLFAENALKKLLTIEDASILNNTVFLESPPHKRTDQAIVVETSEANDKGKYEIENYQHNKLTLATETIENQFLYWVDGFDRWWTATVNGKTVPVLRANHNFKAIFLPPGKNKVEFLYRPTPFLLSLALFFGTFTLCLISALACLAATYRHRLNPLLSRWRWAQLVTIETS